MGCVMANVEHEFKWLHDDIKGVHNEIKKLNRAHVDILKQLKEMEHMFKCIDLDGEEKGTLSLSKEYRDKLEEIRQIIGTRTLTETIEMLVDDKVEYFKETLKEE